MDPKICENLAKKAAELRSYNFGKTRAELFAVVAEQEYRLCGVRAPGGGGWPKSMDFARRAS